MGIFRSTKKLSTKIVDVRVDKWLSVDYLKETTNHFKVILIDIFVPKKPKFSESFEEALQRLELSEKDLQQRKEEFTRLFLFFTILSLSVISYGIYLAYKGSFGASLIAFCLSLYALTQAFRFHFWLFQLKNRKLGCTIKEWFNSSAHTTTRGSIVPSSDDKKKG